MRNWWVIPNQVTIYNYTGYGKTRFMYTKFYYWKFKLYVRYMNKCDCLSENLPSSHLSVFREIQF